MKINNIKTFLIIVLSLAIIFVVILIASESENESDVEVEDASEIVNIDEGIFVCDDDGGFWVIEAIPVPEEWKR